MNYQTRLDTNNHILNTVLARICFWIGGDSPFVLRLPNVIAFGFYYWYGWKMIAFFRSKWLGLLWLITLVSPIYILGFFSLCRGYGLSLAFLLAGLYYCMCLFQGKGGRNLNTAKALFCCSAAVWANLSILTPSIVLVGIVLLGWLRLNVEWRSKSTLAGVLLIMLLAIIPLYFAIQYAFALRGVNAFYEGFGYGFYENFILRFSAQMVETYFLIHWIVPLLFLSYLALLFFNTQRLKFKNLALPFHVIWLLTLLGIYLQNILLGVNYPTERTALYLFPLFITPLFFELDNLKTRWKTIVTLMLPAFFVIQLLLSLNFTHLEAWKYTTVSHSTYDYIYAWKKNNKRMPTISAHGQLAAEFDHLDYLSHLKLNSCRSTEIPGEYSDFILVPGTELEKFNSYKQYSEVFKTGSGSLLKRKVPVDWIVVGDTLIPSMQSALDFPGIIHSKVLLGETQALRVDFSVKISSAIQPFNFWVVVQILDISGKVLSYNKWEMSRMNSTYQESKLINRSICIDNLSSAPDKVEVYLWNIDKASFIAKDLHCTLLVSK